MELNKEIESFEDIQKLVNCFYDKVRKDELIGPLFNARMRDRWPQHLEKMYRFWQTVLLGEHTYLEAFFLLTQTGRCGMIILKNGWSCSGKHWMNYLAGKKQEKQNGVPKKWQKCFYQRLNIIKTNLIQGWYDLFLNVSFL